MSQPQQNCNNFDFLNQPSYQQDYQKYQPRRNLNFDQLHQYDNFSNSDVHITPVNNPMANSINQNLKGTIPYYHQNS